MEDYVQEYERASARLCSMTEEQRLGYFMNGLKEDIKRRVRIHEPEELSRAIQLALDIEDEMHGDSYGARTSVSIPFSASRGSGFMKSTGFGRHKAEAGSGQTHSLPGPTLTHSFGPSNRSASAGGAPSSTRFSSPQHSSPEAQ